MQFRYFNAESNENMMIACKGGSRRYDEQLPK